MRKRTIFIISFSQIIAYAIPVITFPLLVKAFGLQNYGVWIETSTISSLVISLGIGGLSNALSIMVLKETERRKQDIAYSNNLYIFLVLGIGLGIFFFLTAPLINNFTIRKPIGVLVLQVAACIPVINSFQVVCIQIFRLREQPLRGASLEILMIAARLLSAIFATFDHDLLRFSVVYILLQLIGIIPFIILAYKDIRLTRPDWSIIRQMSKHAANLTLVSQSNWLVMYGDRLLLSILATSTAVAIYASSYQFSSILIAFGWPYLYALLPPLTEYWKSNNIIEAQQLIRQTTRAINITLLPAVIGLGLTGSALLSLLATEDFAQGGLLIAMIAAGVGLDVLGTSLQYIFYAQGKPHVLRNIYAQAAGLNILANLVAIPLLSYYGAGITTCLTFVYIFYRLWKKTEMPINALFDLSALGRCLLACLPMAIWVLLTVDSNLPRLGLAMAGGAALYGIGLLALKVISIDELLAIPRAIIRRFAT